MLSRYTMYSVCVWCIAMGWLSSSSVRLTWVVGVCSYLWIHPWRRRLRDTSHIHSNLPEYCLHISNYLRQPKSVPRRGKIYQIVYEELPVLHTRSIGCWLLCASQLGFRKTTHTAQSPRTEDGTFFVCVELCHSGFLAYFLWSILSRVLRHGAVMVEMSGV